MKKSFFLIIVLFAAFTANITGEEHPSKDSLILAPIEASIDNAVKSQDKPSSHKPPPSTAQAKNSDIMIGLGAGMSIGSVPLFTLWQNSLPDSMSRMGLSPNFGADKLSGDSTNLKYAVTETPEQFNIILPLTLSFHHQKNDRIAALGVSFFYTSKQFQSMIHPEFDTLNRRVNIHEKLSLYSLSLEATYQKAIPPQYFSIKGSQQTLFSVSVAASPYNLFTRDSKVKTSVPQSDKRMLDAADSARKSFSDLSSNGKALSWRLGITTLRHYGDGGAVETGLFYGGSYNALFYNNDSRTRKSKIYIADTEKDKNLAFLQSKIELRVTLLKSLKREKNQNSVNTDKNAGTSDMNDTSDKNININEEQ